MGNENGEVFRVGERFGVWVLGKGWVIYRHNGVGFWAQQLGCDRPVAGGRWTQ